METIQVYTEQGAVEFGRCTRSPINQVSASIKDLINFDLANLQAEVLEEALEPEPLPFYFR